MRWKRWALAATGVLALGACTLMLDRSATQCKSDAECSPRFGDQLVCRAGVCVQDCFSGEPQPAQDFLNHCTTAKRFAYDNCAVGLCTPDTADAGNIVPPRPEGGAPGAGTMAPDPSTLPACADASEGRGQVVNITGSSNFPPLLAKLAPLIIRKQGYVPVYQITSSCNGVKTIFSSVPKDHIMVDPVMGSTGASAQYLTEDGTFVPCSLGGSGAQVDIGESDIFSDTCNGFGAPGATIGEYLGPIQAMLFVVPTNSPETVISAEAARAVFGRGGLAPWTSPESFFVRNANTGTQQMIGRAIGVPAEAFWGVDRGSARNVDSLMRSIIEPGAATLAIGIISNDFYDGDRLGLRALAFKAVEQSYGYLPDSSLAKTDKKNVRDGHYPIWGPLHFFTAVSTDGTPSSPAANAFVQVASVPGQDVEKSLFDAYIGSGLVPSCAMSVQRTRELGPLSVYSPAHPCGCYFEASPSVNGSAPPECTKCETANDCKDPARPACNLGYCEVR
jgi:hypothetical protein